MAVMEVNASAHPQADTLRQLAQGRLSAADAAAAQEHLAQCESCCRLLEAMPEDSFVGRLRAARELPRGETVCAETTLCQEDPAELADHPRYRLVRLLGQGGMGAVYLAEQRRMGRPVALKVINAELLNQRGALARFQQEARAAAKLDHPNIVAAYDADQAGKTHFLVMEYVEGQNLSDYLKQHGPLPVAQACNIIRQAALGLQHAHERGMVHRDIKPHNLMLTPAGQVKVLDFGLARLATNPALAISAIAGNSATNPTLTCNFPSPPYSGERGRGEGAEQAQASSTRPEAQVSGIEQSRGMPPHPQPLSPEYGGEGSRLSRLPKAGINGFEFTTPLTAAGAVLGSADYIAPEQAHDAHAADSRSDIYSLGCTLYQLLTNQLPFPGGTAPEKLQSHRAAAPRGLASLCPEIPHDLEKVVNKMIAKRPLDRFQTAAEVAVALARFTVAKPPSRFRPRLKIATAALVLGICSMAAAAGVVRLSAGDREIIIETDDPSIEVVVRDDKIVRIVDPKSGKAYQLDRKELTLSLADDPNGLAVTLDGGQAVTLKREGKKVAVVRVARARLVVNENDGIRADYIPIKHLKASRMAVIIGENFNPHGTFLSLRVNEDDDVIEIKSIPSSLAIIRAIIKEADKKTDARETLQPVRIPPLRPASVPHLPPRTSNPNQSPPEGFGFTGEIPSPAIASGMRPSTPMPPPSKPLTNERLIQIEVTCARINRTEMRQLAARLNGNWTDKTGKQVAESDKQPQSIFGVINDRAELLKALHELVYRKLATIVSEPRIVAKSGISAWIVSGGEVPLPPILDDSDAKNPKVTYKMFGFIVGCTPIIQPDGKIQLKVSPELSDVDNSLDLNIDGTKATSVPGFRMQKSEVTVQLEPGKTLVMGGFIDKTPNEEERELIILVTPRIVDPEPEKEVQLDVSVTRVKTEETQLAWPEEPKNLPFVPAEELKKSEIKIAVFRSQDCALQRQLSDLRDKRRAKLVLERRLMTMSGHSADIGSGGQMPVIAKTSNGASQIHYIPVGTMLKLLPTIVDAGRIRLSFSMELSNVDHSMPTTVTTSAGTARMPGLITRNITNAVELRRGETIAIRGIVHDGEETFVLVTPRAIHP